MNRRSFITLIGGAAAARPLAAHAQGSDRFRRIGALMPEPESYPESQARLTAFQQAIAKLGWTVGRTLVIDCRWEISNVERARDATADLLGLAPDVILTVATPATVAATSATSTIPVVFVAVAEPVSQGIVAGLAHPGGNLTGFTNMEPSFGGKWLEFLKEIAPSVTRVAIMFSPNSAVFAIPIARSVEAAAQQFAVETETALVHGPQEIEAALTKLAGAPGGGLILPPDPLTAGQRKLIVELAARHRLPAIYGLKFFATEDGLAFYGADILDQMRRAAGYVDRILRGEKPADLPVQQPTQFQLVINLKAAKAIGLDVSPTLLARADEVIE